MLNLLKESVETLNNGFNTLVNGLSDHSNKLDITFCKFDILHLNFLKTNDNEISDHQNNFLESDVYYKPFNVLFIVHSDFNLNVYHVTDDLNIKCFFSTKFPFPLHSVDSVVTKIKLQMKENPVVGIVSNNKDSSFVENNVNESFLKFFSLKSKRIVHNLRFNKKINKFISKQNFFAISFNDGTIQIYDNNIINFLTIETNTCEIKRNKLNAKQEDNNKTSRDTTQINSYLQNNVFDEVVPIFDISENFILFYKDSSKLKNNLNDLNLDKNQISEKINLDESKNTILDSDDVNTEHFKNKYSKILQNNLERYHNSYNSSLYYNSLESYAIEGYKNISKLKDWSLSQLNDLINLRSATKLTNNSDLKDHKKQENNSSLKFIKNNINNCCLIMYKIYPIENSDEKGEENINQSKLNENTILQNLYKINVPFFEDGLSILKFLKNSKYFLVGNKNSQMFYLYESFPQSNLKYTKESDCIFTHQNCKNSIYTFKICYSIYRGVTGAKINTIDLSENNDYLLLGSNKGTVHIFNLPKKENQIIENSSVMNYEEFDQINQKVICAKNLEKIKSNNFMTNSQFKSASLFLTIKKSDIENILIDSKQKKTQILENKLTVLLNFIDNNNSVDLYVINKFADKSLGESNLNHLKKVSLAFSNEEINFNYNELTRKGKLNTQMGYNHILNNIYKLKTQFKEFIELETTDKNFSKIHINPLFNYSFYKIIPEEINHAGTNSNKENNHSKNNIKISEESLLKKEKGEDDKTKENTIDKVVNVQITPSFNNATKNKIFQNYNLIKSRSNSICLRNINANYSSNVLNCLNANQNTYANDINIHEKLTGKEITYFTRNFSAENTKKRIHQSNERLSINKHPQYSSNYNFFKARCKKIVHKINSSLSDHSSSLENSNSLNGVLINNEIFSNYDLDNNKENIILKDKNFKQQLQKDMETNISEKINKKIDVVKVITNFKIDDNYYGHK